jgi:glyoxylase-like metal-dependent hydrolase (beta-lactamase superfamily II)
MFPRRRFLLGTLTVAAFNCLPTPLLRASAAASTALPAWKPGVLEIHHIATNRGNSALLILPDGTTMMVDAGAIYGATPCLSDPLPSAQRRPGEWIGRYAKRRLETSGLTTIHAVLLTHLHGDHIGYLPTNGARSSNGPISSQQHTLPDNSSLNPCDVHHGHV